DQMRLEAAHYIIGGVIGPAWVCEVGPDIYPETITWQSLYPHTAFSKALIDIRIQPGTNAAHRMLTPIAVSWAAFAVQANVEGRTRRIGLTVEPHILAYETNGYTRDAAGSAIHVGPSTLLTWSHTERLGRSGRVGQKG